MAAMTLSVPDPNERNISTAGMKRLINPSSHVPFAREREAGRRADRGIRIPLREPQSLGRHAVDFRRAARPSAEAAEFGMADEIVCENENETGSAIAGHAHLLLPGGCRTSFMIDP